MAQTVVMPKLGLTMTEGKIAAWLKKEGDAVKSGEGLFDVETDKLTNTIEASSDGILRKIIVAEGETVPCLEAIAIIAGADENIDGLVGASAAAPAAAAETEKPASAAAPSAPPAAAAGGVVVASPAAKKLAKDKGIDLAQVAGTGPKGRITIEDVEKFLASPAAAQPKASGLAAKMAADKGIDLSTVTASGGGRIMSADVKAAAGAGAAVPNAQEIKPLSGMRKVIAKRMRESQDISPTVNYVIPVDMTAMKAAKAELASEGIKVSYTDILVKLTARTLMEFPLLNCSIDGDTMILKNYVNMGVAVALNDGLLVPVVTNAHAKCITEISAEIKSLAEKARSGQISPDNLQGGTFTISNLGMFGIESFTPIINQPEVAILGANAMVDTVVAVDGVPTVRPIMKLSLTADHRAVDGAVAAQFMAKLKKYLEKPSLLLLG